MKKIFLLLISLACVVLANAQNLQTGVVTFNQPNNANQWFTTTFEQPYAQPPVVIAGPLLEDGSDPAHVRIRNVTTTGFEYQAEKFDSYPTSGHKEVTFTYLAIAPGNHTIGGQSWEAGVIPANTDGNYKTVPFNQSFNNTNIAVVFAQLASNNDPTAAMVRINNVTNNSFDIKLVEEELETQNNPGRSASDDIYYLALQRGGAVVSFNPLKLYSVDITEVNHQPTFENFGRSYKEPIFLATSQTEEEGDPFWINYHELNGENVQLRLREENQNDSEVNHAKETVAYLIMDRDMPSAKRLIWNERFELQNAMSNDNGLTAWSVNSTQNNTKTTGGNLVSRGDEATWTSEPINITGFTEAKVRVRFFAHQGDKELDDHIKMYYTLNGGPEVPLLNGLAIGAASSDATNEPFAIRGGIPGINGTNSQQLRVIVKFKSDATDERYIVDEVQVYAESNERHLIENNKIWGDPNAWSYTPGGPSCSCVPNRLSDTYIHGPQRVRINASENTRNLTVLNGGTVEWVGNNKKLRLWGDAALDVQAGGKIKFNGTNNTGNQIIFNQWNLRDLSNDQTRVGSEYPGVNVTVNVDEPTGITTNALFFNAAGTYTIQGNGSIQVANDMAVNHQAEVTNNLSGTLAVGDELLLNYSNITFTNNGIINADFVDYQQNNILLNNRNSASITVNNIFKFGGSSGALINEGVVQANSLAVLFNGNSGQVVNQGTFTVSGGTQSNNLSLSIENFGTVDLAGDIFFADQATFYNREDATWYFGGRLDSNIQLFANEPNNEVHYNGIENQLVLIPRQESNAAQDGAYWDIFFSNKNGSGVPRTSIKTPPADALLDVNGNLTITDTNLGRAILDVDAPGADIYLAGDWVRTEAGTGLDSFREGNQQQTVIFDGTGGQTIRSNERFNNFTVDKSSGELSIVESGRIANQATFTRGIVRVVPNGAGQFRSLLFLPTSQVAAVSDASHVVGKVARRGTADFTFPLGDGSVYRPISISNVALPTDESFVAEYFNASPPDVTSKEASITNLGNCGYWNLEDTDATASASVTLHWDENCSVDFDKVVVARWNGTQWVSEGRSALTGDATTGTVTAAALNAFGLFTLAEEKAVNTPLAIDDEAVTNVSTTLEGESVLDNDNDPDGDGLVASLVSNPTNGTLTLRTDGTYTYVPNAAFSGTDTFQYQACDEGEPVACDIATVTITVRVPNAAPEAQNDSLIIDEDNVLNANVLTNDTDQNQEDVLSVNVTPVRAPQHGTVVLQANGNLTYTPARNFFGTDSLSYVVCDSKSPALCDTAWILIYVNPVNDAPVAVNDTLITAEGEYFTSQVLTNDYDIEGDALVNVTLVSSVTNGTLELRSDGSFVYQPSRTFIGEDQFVYQVCDDQTPSLCSQATVTLIVEAGLLVVPKGFSPNGDGREDRLIIQGISGYPNNRITIFNRWGNIVYQAVGYDNQQIYWQGESSRGIQVGGNTVPKGTYFYTIDLGPTQKPLSGYLVLER